LILKKSLWLEKNILIIIMIYDSVTNLIDAIKICDTASHCIGHRKETILTAAINDMMEAFKETGNELSEEEIYTYNRYLACANRNLDSVIRQKKKQGDVKFNTADNITDASNVLQTAMTCTGTRRASIVARAEWELAQAKC
jgi:hypothetical protein